ncbi:lipid A deacylase LpxR family protein [Vibrio sp. SCSIO 43135]|uniref:lipid A deacylase LpxR family protein n=1 Tax=Vibrio sp. SCSIO 43135 TaxID=2819096 RepID=UPI002075FEBE|nr:lipid A deacylase LpxR family protein [Vibrio sp. SCSIO 43135]USD40225.1 lipid A deacylase LpxR family protein [Vibrio sp. SCSIO 43135]
MKFTHLLPLLLLSTSAVASERSTVTFGLDNDGVFGVDQDYTNGIFLSYTSSAINEPWLIFKPLSLSFWGAGSLDKWEFTLGHKMWTPSDIEDTTPRANDRPYAGYFHGELNYISLHPQQAQRFNLTLGATGENSYADQAQKLVHSITGSDDPNGWEFQIDDEVVGSVGYLSHFNLMRNRSIANTDWEISNVSEANVGNFRSDVSTGLMFRWGTDLAGNMGAANISTENPFRAGMIGASNSAWFVFTGIEGRYRFNDITIEGDRSGVEEWALENGQDPSIYDVTLENVQASAVAGVAWYNEYVGVSLAATVKTPDYKEATESIYGTGAFSFWAFF